ncbi:DUF1990 family protein [Rathayibacter soli]|uniref:DUF1990 family protein n=1 Tax=Rathayibacter soli TaxID=3144168 RepID=UPI0027E5BAB1|nr:DUF1990 domain-containing protein [Glaciibacter superstes]
MRRSTFTDASVTYGSVGGTQAEDLLFYPPKGYRPLERSIRLGSGRERFESSVDALMTWGVQRGSGIEVTDIDRGTGEEYSGIVFNEDGSPAELQDHHSNETLFTDDGTAYIANGMTAVLKIPVGPFHIHAPLRVVYVVRDANRAGFAYGTLRGHPESGEEAFILEHRDDDSVWLVIRAFSRPSNFFYRIAAPILRVKQSQFTKRYLRALHPVSAA